MKHGRAVSGTVPSRRTFQVSMRTLLLFIFMTATAWSPDATACDCLREEDEPARAFQNAPFVIDGRVRAVHSDTPSHMAYEVLVHRAWQWNRESRDFPLPTAGSITTVLTSSSDCGYWFSPGDRVLFYPRAKNGGVWVAQCDGSRVTHQETHQEALGLGPPVSALPPNKVDSCTCEVPEPSSQAAFRSAEIVMEAEVQSPVSNGVFRLRALQVWKGRIRKGEIYDVYSSADPCGTALPIGKKVIVYLPPGSPSATGKCVVGARVVTGPGLVKETAALQRLAQRE